MSTNKIPSFTLSELLEKFGMENSEIMDVAEKFPYRVSRYYAGLIDYPFDPIWMQSVPTPDELKDDFQQPDPLDEERLSPVPGLIHRYPDRAVIIASNNCAMYCRFCMRKRQIGHSSSLCDLDACIDYISQTDSIRDVLVSGGDPLLLDIDALNQMLSRIRKIKHVEILRIGSRIPVVAPSLVNDELCRMLASHHPLYLNTHFNHPYEITTESAAACGRLADAGIQLGNQTVLLNGINDNTDLLAELFSGLLRIRVKPYYLHQMDLVKGTAHFRTPLARGMEIVKSLRGRISGMAIPHFCVDLPGGRGKVSLLPEIAARLGDRKWSIVAPDGEKVLYCDP